MPYFSSLQNTENVRPESLWEPNENARISPEKGTMQFFFLNDDHDSNNRGASLIGTNAKSETKQDDSHSHFARIIRSRRYSQ